MGKNARPRKGGGKRKTQKTESTEVVPFTIGAVRKPNSKKTGLTMDGLAGGTKSCHRVVGCREAPADRWKKRVKTKNEKGRKKPKTSRLGGGPSGGKGGPVLENERK